MKNNSLRAMITVVLLFQLHQVNVPFVQQHVECQAIQVYFGLIFISANFSE